MPDLSEHTSSVTTKLLYIGESGSGKTGSLASLASEGYNVRILDFDNGIDVLKDIVSPQGCEKFKYKPDTMSRIKYCTIQDHMKAAGGKIFASAASAWPKAVSMLDNWKTEQENLGPLTAWGTSDVLVIDTLTNFGAAAYNFVLAMNNKIGGTVTGNEYRRFLWSAQDLVESALDLLTSPQIKCNIIVSSHISYQDKPGTVRENSDQPIPQQGFPSALGKALSPRIPRGFNSTLMAEKIGTSYQITTKTANNVNLKTSAPSRVKDSYPLSSGLAEYFKAVRGG